jgi:hypothetical protein
MTETQKKIKTSQLCTGSVVIHCIRHFPARQFLEWLNPIQRPSLTLTHLIQESEPTKAGGIENGPFFKLGP